MLQILGITCAAAIGAPGTRVKSSDSDEPPFAKPRMVLLGGGVGTRMDYRFAKHCEVLVFDAIHKKSVARAAMRAASVPGTLVVAVPGPNELEAVVPHSGVKKTWAHEAMRVLEASRQWG